MNLNEESGQIVLKAGVRMKQWWLTGTCLCISDGSYGGELHTQNKNNLDVITTATSVDLASKHKSDKMHTQPYMPPPQPKGLPWESVPKQLTVWQVHEHGGTPTETGQDLTEKTSQATGTLSHLQFTTVNMANAWFTESPDVSPPHFTTVTCSFSFASFTVFKQAKDN